jgi:DNA-binding NarL/FixJ family response regulator
VSKTRVLLADDHAVVRAGLKALVDAEPDMAVVAEAGDGREAVRLAAEAKPDVAVLDLSMPEMNGAQAAAAIRRDGPAVKVLALTVHEDRSYLKQVLEAGASGYVLKRSAAEELIHAIRAVAAGGVYLDPALAGRVVAGFVGEPAAGGAPGGAALSDREEEVLRLIAQGFSNKEIAARLDVSVKTVETYKARAMQKLDLRSRVDIIRYALGRGWLHEP